MLPRSSKVARVRTCFGSTPEARGPRATEGDRRDERSARLRLAHGAARFVACFIVHAQPPSAIEAKSMPSRQLWVDRPSFCRRPARTRGRSLGAAAAGSSPDHRRVIAGSSPDHRRIIVGLALAPAASRHPLDFVRTAARWPRAWYDGVGRRSSSHESLESLRAGRFVRLKRHGDPSGPDRVASSPERSPRCPPWT